MRILHVVPAYHPEGPGGIERTTRALVCAQRERGDEPLVLCGASTTRPACTLVEETVDGVPVLRLHRDRGEFEHPGRARHAEVEALFLRVLAARAPDVVHVHHWLRLSTALVRCAHAVGVPSVVTLHDHAMSCPRAYRVDHTGATCTRRRDPSVCVACVPRGEGDSEESLLTDLRRLARDLGAELDLARVVLVSQPATRVLLADLGGLDAARFEVLPLGVPRRFGDAAPLPLRSTAGRPVRIASWGRQSRDKGSIVLAATARELVELGVVFELDLFGEVDATEGFADRLAASLRGLPVRLHGPYNSADLLSAQPDLAVFASLAMETHGLVIDEAIELGLPCVVACGGAIADRLGSGALVVPPGDPRRLARALALLAGSDALRGDLVGRCPPLAPAPAEHAAALEAVYRRAIAPLASARRHARPSTPP